MGDDVFNEERIKEAQALEFDCKELINHYLKGLYYNNPKRLKRDLINNIKEELKTITPLSESYNRVEISNNTLSRRDYSLRFFPEDEK